MSAQQGEHVEHVLQQGIVAAKAGQHREARKLLKQAIRLDPQNVTAWLWLSSVLQDPLEQESALEKVLQLEPDHAAARQGVLQARERVVTQLLSAGQGALRSGDLTRARELFSQVVARDEEQLEAWVGLSMAVDTAVERQVCFENILTLDPENRTAQRGLDLLEQAAEAANAGLWSTPESEEYEGNFGRGAASLAGDILGEEYAERHTAKVANLIPESVSPIQHLWEKFEDEYACPYCAHPTEPQDLRCSACEQELWLGVYAHEQPSNSWRFVLAVKIILTLVAGFLFFYFMAVFNFVEDLDAFYNKFTMTLPVLGPVITELDVAQFMQTTVIVAGVYFFISLAGTFAFYLRWLPMYYWMFFTGVLAFLSALVKWIMPLFFTLFSGGSSIFTLVGLVFSMFFPALYFYSISVLEPDFTKHRKRILTRLDKDAKDSMTCFIRGRLYASREMWALAAVHLRLAVAMMQNHVDAYLILIFACINLEEYELAEFLIVEARRIDPQDARIAGLAQQLENSAVTVS